MIRTITLILTCALSLTGCLSSEADLEVGDDVYVLEGIGSPEACLASDTPCLENKFSEECNPYSTTVIETCLEWLADLEDLPIPESAQIKLLKASTYYRLSELRHWTSLTAFPHLSGQGAQLLTSEEYLAKVRALGQEVYNHDKSSTEAMRILSLTSESDEERLQWQRLIVKTETPDYLTCRLLHGALNRVYSPGDGSRADSEAARCYITSYRESETRPVRWNIAGAAVNSLESAGQTNRKNRFVSEVRNDIDPEHRLHELANMRRLTPEEVEFTLQTLCLGSVREMLGIEYCSRALEEALHAVSRLAPEVAAPYADAAMEGIMARIRSTVVVETQDLTLYSKVFAVLVEQEIIAKGFSSGKIYSTYSIILNNDLDKSIAAQTKAVELEPLNANYRVRLGELYHQRGDLELAIQQYQQALERLPDYRKESLRTIIGAMKIELN